MKYTEAVVELKPSKIVPTQVGLFALKDFKENEIIADKYTWDESRLISWNEFETLDHITKNKLVDFCYKTDEGIYAPQNINKINIAYFINHSCDPNSYCDSEDNYRATRDIKTGEEFTIDVEALMKKTVIEFKCHCGSPKCRKIVRI
ncbi:MAG: SET domain-containing protein-lysine N-methyltransferase [Nitrospirae bacterium]|nr:SET domain-containing protein-lysine N-methyltransferase [Nitrospirota bacterium]